MTGERRLQIAVRYGLPIALAIAGIVLVAIGGLGAGSGRNPTVLDSSAPTTGAGSTTAIGVVLIGLGLLTWMINWLYRATISSGDDRDKEERNRDYFTEHGHWPGEGPG